MSSLIKKPHEQISSNYGKCCKKFLNKGAHGCIHLYKNTNGEMCIFKELKQEKNESKKHFIKRIASEFCISSVLEHPHIVKTLDLIKDSHNHWCEVMEYCENGDLYQYMQTHKMNQSEICNYFRQLTQGVLYLHENGIAHKDLKPENLVLDSNCNLKITDFGEAEVFKTPFEKDIHLSHIVSGTYPYMAPEEFIHIDFDARAVDIWACGIILLVLFSKRFFWTRAITSDPGYCNFLKNKQKCFTNVPFRDFIISILDPDPNKRMNIHELCDNIEKNFN